MLPQLERLAIGIGQLPSASVMPALRELRLDLGRETPRAWRGRAPLLGVRHLVVHAEQPLAEPTEILGLVPALQRITICGPPGTVNASGLDALAARVDEVDVLSSADDSGSPSMRRFRSRQPRMGCLPAALLAVVSPNADLLGRLVSLPDDRQFVLGRSVSVDLALGRGCSRHARAIFERGAERWRAHFSERIGKLWGMRTHGVQLHDGDELGFADHVFRFLEGDCAAHAAVLRRQLALPIRSA